MTDAKVMDEMAPPSEASQETAEHQDTDMSAEERAPAAVEVPTQVPVSSQSGVSLSAVDEGLIEAAAAEDTLMEEAFADEVDGAFAADDEDDEEEDIPHLARISFDDDEDEHSGDFRESTELAEPAEDAEIPLELIDHDALWVVRRLRAKGYEAYLTGGCVRDLLLGRKPKDFDVATAAHPEQVKRVFRNCRLIGRRFRLAHIYFPTGKVIETATFRANPLDLQEDLPEDLLVERDNVFGTVEEDARRRDLTINGLFYDPLAGKVLDFVDGRQDLDARLIRTIGDPDIRFQEDPVRILRAIKFATRLDFEIETQTLVAMRAHVGDLARCAAPRLLEELHRLLSSGKATSAFRLCEQVGVLDVLVPELTQVLHAGLDLARYSYGPSGAVEAERILDGVSPLGAREDDEHTQPFADAVEAAEVDARAEPSGERDEVLHPIAGESEAWLPATEPMAIGESAQVEMANADADAGQIEPASPHDGAERTPRNDSGETEGVEEISEDVRISTTSLEDDLASEPSTAEPVLLTPEQRYARYTALLESLDAAHARDAELSSAVSFAALLLPGYETYHAAGGNAMAWLDDVTGAWAERIRLTRHDRETIRYLCRALAQLNPSLRRGAKARHLVGRPWFREALLLYTLSLHAAGESLEEVGRWKVVAAHYQKPFKQPKKGDRQERPRRMRRARRGGGEHRRGRRR